MTWTIAWARLLALSRPLDGTTEATTLIDGSWPLPVPAHWPDPSRFMTTRRSGFVMNAWDRQQEKLANATLSAVPSGSWQFLLMTFGVGWPRPCLRWSVWREDHFDYSARPSTFTSTGTPPQNVSRWASGLDVPSALARYDPDTWKRLPVRPPVPMFENIAFFSAVLVAPFFLYRVTRYTARRIAHRCARCGYSREGLPKGAPCPECGR